MSLILGLGTKPLNLRVKTLGCGMGNTIHIGDYEIPLEDFLFMVHYVLTNTDLFPEDPRLHFVECVKSMREISGYNIGGKRLIATVEPVVLKPQ